MTQNHHASFGPVPKHEFERAKKAPYGQAARILRKYDPMFGLVENAENLKYFSVSVSRIIEKDDHAIVKVRATTEDAARELVDKMDWTNFDWHEHHFDEESMHTIDEVNEEKQ